MKRRRQLHIQLAVWGPFVAIVGNIFAPDGQAQGKSYDKEVDKYMDLAG
jgi:hypothetical protein